MTPSMVTWVHTSIFTHGMRTMKGFFELRPSGSFYLVGGDEQQRRWLPFTCYLMWVPSAHLWW